MSATNNSEQKNKTIASSADILSSLKNRNWAKSSVSQDMLDAVGKSRLEKWLGTKPNLTPEEKQSLSENPEENPAVRPL